VGVRAVAARVFQDWKHGDRHAAELIEAWSARSGLAGQDRAFLQDVVLTVLRNVTLLDHWVGVLTEGRHLDDGTRWLLRSGLTELLLLEVAEHAAVNENVNLAGRASGLVNAVLRRACRQKASLLGSVATLPEEVRFSQPKFLLERWQRQFGAEATQALAAWNQQPAPMYVRCNGLHPDAVEKMATIAGLEPLEEVGFYRCVSLPREALAEGWCYAQDLSTAAAPRLLAPQAGETVLDACAAPGGKSALLAELMGNEGRLVACDLDGARLRRLRENLTRLQVRCAEVHAVDWLADEALPFAAQSFDKILLDVPCSNTGVMRRRVDVRWRLSEAEFDRLIGLQQAMVERCLPLLKPGGRLVYSTCSIDAEENQQQVEGCLRRFAKLGWRLEKAVQLLPQRDQTDGAFAASFVRQV
jgi:16S rRNA (cytosine967-C5)-methyltransferase